MKASTIVCSILAGLLLAACGREATHSDGNGPGNADGVGGREDPSTVPAAPVVEPASDTPPPAETPPAAQ